jgi:hypothetical protein
MGTVVAVSEFFDKVSRLKKDEQKVEALRMNDSFIIRALLQSSFHPHVEWALPPGEPPYKPNDLVDQEHILINESKKLNYFVKQIHPNLNQSKRELMFIELLENVDPKDAKMLCGIKDKKFPFKGITADIVREAFPDLIPPAEEIKG